MPKNIRQIIIRVLCFVLCAAILIAAPVMIAVNKIEASGSDSSEMSVLTVWQIDSFEGGKGSRASYLESVGKSFSVEGGCYIRVVSLSASAARENISIGNLPDIISYGAGIYGIERIISGGYYTWAHGGYCFLTTDENADFIDISNENTVINEGTDNLSSAVALMCGVGNAVVSKPTGAYVSLIGGEYKYLLGTQRDIYRLKTRGVSFKIKPITEFNDLYQNISVTTVDTKKVILANAFIEYLLSKSANITKLGLMGESKLYDDEMSQMELLNYEYKLKSPVSENTHNELLNAIAKSDINLLKNLLK